MQEYVLILGQPIQSIAGLGDIKTKVLLVEKQKPAWQKGRWNLVGGHVEEGELPLAAAIREMKEEAGNITCHGATPEKCGVIVGEWGKVHCYRIWCDPKKAITPREGEIENVFWADWEAVRHNEKLLPNLRVIIPMMLMGSKEWTITDEGPSFGKETHSFSIEVKSTTKNFC